MASISEHFCARAPASRALLERGIILGMVSYVNVKLEKKMLDDSRRWYCLKKKKDYIFVKKISFYPFFEITCKSERYTALTEKMNQSQN